MTTNARSAWIPKLTTTPSGVVLGTWDSRRRCMDLIRRSIVPSKDRKNQPNRLSALSAPSALFAISPTQGRGPRIHAAEHQCPVEILGDQVEMHCISPLYPMILAAHRPGRLQEGFFVR